MKIQSTQWKRSLKARAESVDIRLDKRQLDLMAVFASELIGFNARFNLTAITDPKEIIDKHLIDSVIPAKFIPETASVLDIGTGGGLPGIPLKIYKPSLSVTLIDASRKKTNFVKYIIRRLGLQNATAGQGRAESLAESVLAGISFDVVISRAFTSLERLVSYSMPVLKEAGLIIAMKGKPERVSPIASRLDIQTVTYHLPDSTVRRSLVIMRKHSSLTIS